ILAADRAPEIYGITKDCRSKQSGMSSQTPRAGRLLLDEFGRETPSGNKNDRRAPESRLLSGGIKYGDLTFVATRSGACERHAQTQGHSLRAGIQAVGDRQRCRFENLDIAAIETHERDHRLRGRGRALIRLQVDVEITTCAEYPRHAGHQLLAL